ncbi:MAG: cadherin-like domain-containing protein [Phycisphaerae bacterium]|nr:cadherin-like domain-containing protein [Phycisphaerae bacterium]
MGILKHIKDRRLFPSTDSEPVRPPVLERLEPRIMLSGDGLLSIAPPDPFQDALLNTMPQVVQYAELLETSEQVEEEVSQELDPSDTLNADIYQPIFTFFVDDNTNDENETADDLSIDNVGRVQTGDDIAVLSDDSEKDVYGKITATEMIGVEGPTANSPAVPTEDGSMPTQISDVDLSIEYATSIEIRGPPVDVPDSLGTFILSNYATSDGFAKTSGVGGLYQLKAPDLPGLQLDDPDISSWNRQVVYLDFDGAEDVTYNGPVSVEGIDVPAFVAPGELVGSEEAIIAGVLEEVNQLFSDSGVVFTLEEPQADQGYSTIFIGGDDSAFAEYGEFFGLAAQVDVGNKDRGDEASVFSDNILSAIRFNGLAAATSRLAGTIAHEAGHLVGYGHGHVEVGGGLLQSVAEAVYHPHIAFDISGDGSASGTWYTDDPYFLFTPSTAGTATFTHGHGDGDATMKLYDSGSNSLLKTESDSDSSNSMTYSVTAGTEYRLWLDLPWNQTGFSVNIDLPAPPVVSVVLDPHGDAVYPNQWISPSTEGEYWEYTAPGLGNLEIEADSVGGVGWDTDLFIYDADKNLIHSDTGSLDDGDYSTTVTAGQVLYFLVRGDVNDEGNDSTGRYDLYIDGPPLPRQLQVPYFSQGDTGWCWAASMSMVLRYYGYNQHPWQIAADRDKSPDKGLDRLEVGDFEAYLEANFDGGDPDAWERDTFYFIEPLVDRLQEILVSGHPVWVAYWGIPLVQNAHVIVITGFDGSADSDHVYVHDPGDDFAGPEPIQHALTWTDFKQKIEEKGSLGITILHSKTANLIEEPSIASVQVNSPASGNLKFQNSLGGISRALLLRWDGREPYSGYYYEPDSSWSGWTLDSDDLYDNYKYNATQSDTMVLMPSYSNYATSGQTLYLRTRAEIRRASDGYLIKSLLSDVDTAEPFTYEPASRYFVTCPLSDVPVDVYRLAVKLEGNTDNGPSYDLLDQCEFYFGVTASVSSSPPKVDAFDVSPRSVAVGDPVTISYTVSDTGGSGLKQVELWRATDDDGDGEPDWPQDPQGYIAVESISGQSSSGFFEDIPSSSGTYWYGLHAVDNAGQWSAEPYPPGAIVVTAADATPPTVDAFDVSPRAVATGDPVTINYVVSDTGGSGLKQVELWRATDVDGDGEPDWSQSPEGYLYVKLLSGQEDTGYFEDIPGDPDTYWYGLHVVDNAGNWSTEPDPPGPIAVTVVAPHIITNVYELQAMNNNLSGWYELGNDIDASDTRNWNDGAGFLPVGHGYGSSITFTGYFDGNGHTISGLYINRPETDYVGLFGYTSSNEIKDVGLIDIDITGRNHVGGLIGMDSRGGSRLRCYTTGSVVGYSTVGGLIGYSYYSSITDCYSTASVSGDSSLGGLIGSKTRYNAGNVYLYGQVTHSYSSGLVTGEVDGTRIGGLVGYSNGTGWDSCYWDIGRSGQTESAGGLGKTNMEMMQQSTFVGWDFDSVWNIDEGVSYPLLRVFEDETQVTPSINSVSPAQPQATNGRQNFTIHGSNFDESAAYIKLYDQVGNVHPLSGDRVLSRSTTQIVVNPDFTSNGAGIWQAEVVNSSGQTSSRYYFEVVAVQQGYYRGELTFRAEGATLEETRWIHWPGTDKSGVTIGRGYDLGERDSVSVIQDLIDAGIPQDQAEAIGAAAGLKGEAAGVFVVHNRDSIGPITLVQQKALFDLVYPGYVTQTQSNYEYHRYYDEGVLLQEPLGLPWDSLHWAIQDVLVDFVYQGYGKMEPGYHRPLRAGMNNRFDELINYIDTTEEMSAWEPGRQRIPFLRAFYTDYDEDGVGSTDEQGPLGDDIYYDGNGDAVPDSLQGNATSFHTTTGHYVTLSCPDTSNLSDVRAVGNPSPSDVPTGINMPYGFFDFTVDGIIPGESVAITLHVPDGSVVGSYYKYGPTPDNPANHWYEFMYDGQTGAEIIGDIITLHFVDGLRGDDDLTANGVVVEPGAPVLLLDITINEVDVDTPGVDAAEFIELYDGGVGNTPLNGLVLVLFNGDNDQSYRAFDLDGYSTNAEGYFVIGDPDVPNVDYTSGFSASSSNIQNGADAVALYVGDAADFPNGTPVTTDHLLDSLVYDTNDADDAGLLVLLNAGQPQVNEDGAGDMANHANARIPNGGTRRNTDTYTQQLATPGTSNENQPPTDIQLDSTSVAENQPIGSVVGRISTTDPDTGDTFTYSLVSGTGDEDNASFTISGDQLLTGEVFDFETKNSCSIRVRTTDNDGLSYEEVFTVTMIDVNDAPVAEDNAYVTDEDTTLNVAAPGVMDNDSDVDGNTLNAVLNVGPTNGTVTLNSDGSFTYTPNANFNGTDSFTYYANDGLLDSNVATVMLTVNAVNDTPQIGTDHTNVIVNEGDVAENTGTFSDVDQGDVVSMTASVGTVVPVGTQNGTWSWSSTATDGPSSSQIVTITATNQSGASSQTTFDLIVKNVAPVVTAGPDQSDDEGNAVSFSGSFTDAGSADIHTIEWDFGDGQTTSGILTPDHTYVANGVYTVTLTVTDNDGGMGSDTLTVTVHDLGPTAVLAGDTTLDEGQSGSFDAGGSTSAPDSIAEYKWDWHYDGANFNLSGDTGAGQSHVWNDPGTYTVAVQVTDEDGSVDIAVLTVAVHDITAPVVTVDTLTTADQTPGLSGTVDDAAAIVKVTVGGQTYTATNHGATWTLPDDTIGPALAVGTYDVQVMATDTVGNEGTDDTVNELTIESASQEPQLASDLVSMQASGLRYNRRTGVMSSYITITNTSSNQVISGDVHFVINSLSDSNVSLVGGDGTTATGTYYDLTPYLNDGRLDPGESVTIRLDFYNPLRRRFTFEWDLWGVIG